MLDKETETYYNNFFELFNNVGWKQLIEELTVNANVVNSVETVKDSEELFVRKGQLSVLAQMLNLETTINTSYEEAVNDA